MNTHPDILGPGYTTRTLELQDGSVATLVRKPSDGPPRGAVLYLHGYVDYFFQTHLADFFTARGRDFYALDLRRYGRSLQESDLRWFTTDLREYFEELDLAITTIRGDGHTDVIGMAHSTGGLILPLWLHARRAERPVQGMILNSPWLDLQKDWFTRTVGTRLIHVAGRIRPTMPLPEKLTDVYPASIHQDRHGEWDFHTDWKPLSPVAPLAAWFSAVRRGHARLHKGLELDMPVLVMRSDKSLLGLSEWTPEAMTADTVLDVEDMQRWSPAIASSLTVEVIPDAMHDIVLSREPVRDYAFERMESWLEGV